MSYLIPVIDVEPGVTEQLPQQASRTRPGPAEVELARSGNLGAPGQLSQVGRGLDARPGDRNYVRHMPEVFDEARVVLPPARVLARTGDGVWTAELHYWLRDHNGRWWGHVESIIQEHRRRRAIVLADHLERWEPQRVEAYLEVRWRRGELLGWGTVVDERRRHSWEGLVDIVDKGWKRDTRWTMWFRAEKIRGAATPPARA